MKVALPRALWEICILSTLAYLGRQNRSVMCFSVQELDVFAQAAVCVCERVFHKAITFRLCVVVKIKNMFLEAQKAQNMKGSSSGELWGEI